MSAPVSQSILFLINSTIPGCTGLQTLNKLSLFSQHSQVEGIINFSHLLPVSEYRMRDRLFSTSRIRTGEGGTLLIDPPHQYWICYAARHKAGAQRGMWKQERRRTRGEKKKDFQELNALKRWIVKLKEDTKESELLMQPLGELHSIIYNRDRLKID